MRERDIERHLANRCKELGALCYKWVSPGRVGVPDRIVVFPNGQVVFIELKAPGKTPSAAQVREIARLRSNKQMVCVLDSIEQIEELLA